MALSDTKTLTSERNAAYVKSNPGRRLTGTVEENKNAFDKFPQLNMDKHNALVDLLITLGIDSIVDDLDSRYTKTETDTKISTETNNLIEKIEFTVDDGKFKITTKGGKKTVIDTVLEKVPASFELVTESGKQYLKVTNQDGTSSKTDVSALFNVYRFEDSDTIDFTESPTYTVTAIIKNNSITLDHLSLAAVSTLEGYVSSAAGSATAAAGSATEAETSANNASTFAQSAKGYSESSASSKNAAEASATAAANAAQTANSKANAANGSAITAQSYAVGGTGTRQGEDTDNAKYYYQMAKEAVGEDFVTQSELATALDGKVNKETGKGLSTNDYTTTDKNKVANVPSNTNTALAGKVDKIAGKGLSTNDYTTTEKNKVANLPANTNTELNKKANTSDVYNKSDADERFAKTVTYTATVGTAWTAKTGYVQQTITVNGILATDNPIIDLVATTADFEAQQEAWSKVFKVTTAANSITLYASEATEKAISLQIKVVR
jgi:hypothetical protein|nr:MAG TPA: Head fiber protein [Caudoviricetes sp.]